MVKFFKIIERICSPPCNIDHGVCGTDPKNPEELICYCQSGYTGDSCDECKTTDFYFYLLINSENYLTTQHWLFNIKLLCILVVCDEFLCYNGASCIVDQFGQAECDCPPGYEGVHCEISK